VDRGRIGKTFSRLVSAMLGFEHTQRDLFAETASMRKQRPSAAGPTGAAAMLSRLAEIEDKARELQTNLEDTERKARSDEEREKQESEWRSRVEAATRDLPVRHAALGEADGRLSAINQELASVEEAMKSADKAARTELNVRKHRLTDDRARLNKEASRLRNEVRGLEQQARAAFEFRPPSYNPPHSPQVSGRFVPRTSTGRSPALEVPDDALPEVGALRFHKKQRYLAIQAWEDLEAGERAAIRLSATLVASEDKGV
jgi:DNA repair exonuclease SbcCD ATPase subunit